MAQAQAQAHVRVDRQSKRWKMHDSSSCHVQCTRSIVLTLHVQTRLPAPAPSKVSIQGCIKVIAIQGHGVGHKVNARHGANDARHAVSDFRYRRMARQQGRLRQYRTIKSSWLPLPSMICQLAQSLFKTILHVQASSAPERLLRAGLQHLCQQTCFPPLPSSSRSSSPFTSLSSLPPRTSPSQPSRLQQTPRSSTPPAA